MLLLTPFEDSTEVYARKYSQRSKFQWKEEEDFLWNMWKEDKFWDSIWKHTVVKNQTIATNRTAFLEAGDLRIHLKNVVENKQIIATSVTMLVHNMAILESIWNTQRRKVKQMQPVWFCIYSGRQFENAFESSQWREAKHNKCNQCDYASSETGDVRVHLQYTAEKSPPCLVISVSNSSSITISITTFTTTCYITATCYITIIISNHQLWSFLLTSFVT